MKEIRILHTADLHLDSPFESLKGTKAAVRRAEQRDLLSRIAALARIENVDLVLLSGDLLDSDRTYYETGLELLQSLQQISAPVFISPGNHDFYAPSSPYARLRMPGNVHVFTENHIDRIDFDELGFRVYGAAFTAKSAGPLLDGFHAEREEGIANIMCIHGEVCTGRESRYNPITPKELENSGMDYVALGHVHAYSGLNQAGSTFYSQPGCPEGRGFDETGEKGLNIVSLADGKCSVKRVNVASRRYERIEVDVTDTDPIAAVQMAMPDETVRDIYSIILKGETELPVNIRMMQDVLSDCFFELKITDRTRIRQSIWDRAEEDSLRGLFLSNLLDRMEQAADEKERMKIEQAARWGLAALDNMEQVVCHED